ncbi:MAG: 16S rRNA (uracil(1498)-N(3))-methyltransferase [Armatimonadetes bacterium]|nr:16S rRNA (uracil(1498)-N(3))-methyltransferase [Armatimonadota bacterium]
MPQRVYLPPERLAPPRVSLPEEAAHYLRHVLRLRPGEEFIAFDGSGAEYRVALRVAAGRPSGEIIERLPDRPLRRLHLTLYQGLPKGKKLPLIIQKITELGAARLVPVQTARATVRLEGPEAEAKRWRWQKIADEAAEQSHGVQPLEVAPVMTWAEALADWQASGAPGLMPDEALAGEEGSGLREALAALGQPEALSVFIGPEGGLAPEEAAAGREVGLRPVSLGPRILRTETAAIVVCALLLYEAGDLG